MEILKQDRASQTSIQYFCPRKDTNWNNKFFMLQVFIGIGHKLEILNEHRKTAKVRSCYDPSRAIFSSFNVKVTFNITSADFQRCQLLLYWK